MPELTTNYQFKKPKANEYAKPDDFNSNFDALDALLKQQSDSIPDGVTVDSAISDTSANPVQNKVISAALKLLESKHAAKTATLTAAGWSDKSQTVTVESVTASNTVFVAPASDSQEVWGKAGIVCTAQSAGSLTFTCKSAPTAAVTANIVILGG